MQESVKIGGIIVPIVKEGGERWYPLSYIINKILLKNISTTQILNSSNEYSKYITKKNIDYNLTGGGKQNTYCINKKGLKYFISKSKIGRLTKEQKIGMNNLLDHLGMSNVNLDERFVKNLDKQIIKKHSTYIQDCINETLAKNKDILWQKCTKCNNYYPYHVNFFGKNLNSSYNFYTVCKVCNGGYFQHGDNYLYKVYREFGEEVYLFYKNHNTIEIYNHFIKQDKKFTPKIISNKKDYLIIIKHLYDCGKIDMNLKNVTLKDISNKFRLTSFGHKITMDELYTHLFGNHFKEYPWKYPSLILKNITNEDAKIIFDNYLKEEKIKIKDVFKFNYSNIICKCGLQSTLNGKILDFILYYFNYEYEGYQFKGGYINYWKKKENRIRSMKHFIEKNLKIPIGKIPLYLTKYTIYKNTKVLYNILKNEKYYKGNLYNWINECYPNKFIEADFNINIIKNEFDSMEEAQIHDYLVELFDKNVIYNQREGSSGIVIGGMIPDWIILRDDGCYLIEYFGLYEKRNTYNTRVSDYIIKTNNKIEKYNNLKKYKYIFLYPNDLKNNMNGLIDKFKQLKD